jgi:hypothetical protein
MNTMVNGQIQAVPDPTVYEIAPGSKDTLVVTALKKPSRQMAESQSWLARLKAAVTGNDPLWEDRELMVAFDPKDLRDSFTKDEFYSNRKVVENGGDRWGDDFIVTTEQGRLRIFNIRKDKLWSVAKKAIWEAAKAGAQMALQAALV